MKVLISGSNRGIGLELCRILSREHQVIALCRNASHDLKALDLHIVEGIDLHSDDCIPLIKQSISESTIDWVINNAGVMERNTLDFDFDSIDRQMQINAYGPLRVVKASLSSLSKGSKIAMITSRMGSIEDNESGGSYGYRMSKASLNMASKSLSVDLKPKGISVGLFHPGYVQTDMTKHSGHLTPQVSAEGLIDRIQDLSLNNSGGFWHVSGEVLPW